MVYATMWTVPVPMAAEMDIQDPETNVAKVYVTFYFGFFVIYSAVDSPCLTLRRHVINVNVILYKKEKIDSVLWKLATTFL